MSHRYFEGKYHAALYQKYRTIPPPQLIYKIISFLKEKYKFPLETAYDVGCGSGQSTRLIAPHFKQVIGTDVSESMIEVAKGADQLSNVTYRISRAEVIQAPNGSVQLITASQAAHWFDMPKFFTEASRVLSPFGVLALFGYVFPTLKTKEGGAGDEKKNEQLKELLDQLYLVDMDGCWAEERKLVDGRYRNFIIPFPDFIRDDTFYHEMETTVAEIGNYVLTWSGFRNYCNKHGEENGKKLVLNFQNRIMKILDVTSALENTVILKRTSFFLLMGRNGDRDKMGESLSS